MGGLKSLRNAPTVHRRRRWHGVPMFGRRAYGCEGLESRVLLATDLGALAAGRTYLQDITAKGTFTSNGVTAFTFSVADCTLDIYLSQHVDEVFRAQVWMVLEGVATTFGQPFFNGELIHVHLDAGTYTLDVNSVDAFDRTKTLAFTVDQAPGRPLGPGGGDVTSVVGADDGRNFGTLKASTQATANDFVGTYDTSGHNGADVIDTYLFDLPTAGTLSATVDQLADDPAGATVSLIATLYRDADHDGLFESNEIVATSIGIQPHEIGTVSAVLNAGHYGLVVKTLVAAPDDGSEGGSDYRVRVKFTPPDSAGFSLGTAADLGTVGNGTVTRQDFLSGADTADVYKFSTLVGGPFVFDAGVTGLFPGSDNLVQLINDANNNGAIDSGEVVASAETFNGAGVHLAASLLTGSYYLRLTRVSGEGPYTLNLSATNSDKGGPAGFPTNFNFNTSALGRRQITDTLSATDVDDYYRFTLETGGRITASFPTTAKGTDADMQLARDLNANGIIDSGELVASSLTRGVSGETIDTPLQPAGNYLLRVFRIAGTPQYSLTLDVDYAGNIAQSARQLALSGDASSTFEFVGSPNDPVDFFRVDTAGPLQLSVFLAFVEDPVTVTIGRDIQPRDGVIDPASVVAFETIVGGPQRPVTANLAGSGTFYIQVAAAGAVGTQYSIVLASAPVDGAGNSPAQARELGVLGTTQTFSDFVGDGSINATDDVEDFYHFAVGAAGPYVFVGQMSVVSGGTALLQLVRDSNGNGVVDAGEAIAATASVQPNVPPPPIVTTLLDPGNYFVRVVRLSGEVTYQLSLTSISTDTAGNTVAAAKSLGTLGPGGGAVSSGAGFVGRIDTDDFYLINLSNGTSTANQPFGELSAALTGAAADAFVEVLPLASANAPHVGVVLVGFNDGSSRTIRLDEGSSGFAPVESDLIQGMLVAPGFYIAHVHGGVDTSYNLTLAFSRQLPFLGSGPPVIGDGFTTGTTIEAEDFDAGGPNVAYVDTTPGNSGGAYRLRDTPGPGLSNVDIFQNADGGFRIDDTDAGESLKYTIDVALNGQYDIDVRAAAAATGATFHLEVDGVIAGTPTSVPVPGTGSTTSFVTVTVQNILLTQGPHVLRLVMDSRTIGAAPSAGAFDSFTIRHSQSSIGTFVVTPPAGQTNAKGDAALSIGWTVPGRSWHELTTIDLRLRDEHGVAAWLRFDEATQTVSLYNPHSRKFGPAKKIGSKGKLSNGDVQIDMADVLLTTAGPDSPTVTLTFALHFNEPRKRLLTVEVAASNDAGFVGDFLPAGTLAVGGNFGDCGRDGRH